MIGGAKYLWKGKSALWVMLDSDDRLSTDFRPSEFENMARSHRTRLQDEDYGGQSTMACMQLSIEGKLGGDRKWLY